MAKISIGDFGYAVPNVTRTQAPTDDGIAGIAAARAGSQVEAAGVNLLYQEGYEKRRLAAEEKQRLREVAHEQEKADTARALRVTTDAETTLYGLRDAFSEEVRQGGHKDLSKLDERIAAAREEVLKNSPPSQADNVAVRFDVDARNARHNADNVLRGQMKSQAIADLRAAGENLSRNFTRDPAGATKRYSALIAASGLPPDVQQAMNQTFIEKGRYAQAVELMGPAKQSMAATQAASKRLNSPEFADLDPTQKGHLQNQLLAMEQNHETRAINAQARANAQAEVHARKADQAWTALVSLKQLGKEIDPATVAYTSKAIEGTIYAKMLPEVLKQGGAETSFARMPAKEREKVLATMNLRGNTPGQGWSAEDHKQYNKLDALHKQETKEFDVDPMKAAPDYGVLPVVRRLDFANIQTIPQQLREVENDALIVSRFTGKPASGLMNDDAEKLGKIVSNMPREMREPIVEALADALADPARMRHLASQMGKENQGLGTSMFLASKNYQTLQKGGPGRPVVRLYMQGEEAIKEKRVSLEKTGSTGLGVEAQIAAEVDGVYATESAKQMAVDVSTKVYAARAAEKGGEFDVSTAVAVGTGGIMPWRGGKVAKPYGWSDAQFSEAMLGKAPQMVLQRGGTFNAGGTRLTAEEFAKHIQGARLQTVDDGKYAVRAGAGYVLDEQGQRFILELQ